MQAVIPGVSEPTKFCPPEHSEESALRFFAALRMMTVGLLFRNHRASGSL